MSWDVNFCALAIAHITAGRCLPPQGADKLCWTPSTFMWGARRAGIRWVLQNFAPRTTAPPWYLSAGTSLPNFRFPRVPSRANLIFLKCTKLPQAIMALLKLFYWHCDKKISLFSKHHPQTRYSQAPVSAWPQTRPITILVVVSNTTNQSVGVSREDGLCHPYHWLIC